MGVALCFFFVARELAPAGLRSRPDLVTDTSESAARNALPGLYCAAALKGGLFFRQRRRR